jgi:hypothetical protein
MVSMCRMNFQGEEVDFADSGGPGDFWRAEARRSAAQVVEFDGGYAARVWRAETKTTADPLLTEPRRVLVAAREAEAVAVWSLAKALLQYASAFDSACGYMLQEDEDNG